MTPDTFVFALTGGLIGVVFAVLTAVAYWTAN